MNRIEGMKLTVLDQMTVELLTHSRGIGPVQKLQNQGYTSLSEFIDVVFELRVPIFVARQIMRHRTFSYMERQATEDIEVYVPSLPPCLKEAFCESVRSSVQTYQWLLADNVKPEIAGMVLPLATMTTFRMKGSLKNWMVFIAERVISEAQLETHEVTAAITAMLHKIAPDAIDTWLNEVGYPGIVTKYMERLP
jgi:thymidylate synthase (FAD)